MFVWLYSLLSTFNDEEQELLQMFIETVISKEKMLNEIQKLMFDQHFYARFLKGHKFDVE